MKKTKYMKKGGGTVKKTKYMKKGSGSKTVGGQSKTPMFIPRKGGGKTTKNMCLQVNASMARPPIHGPKLGASVTPIPYIPTAKPRRLAGNTVMIVAKTSG